MECPLCHTPVRQHLLQASLSIVACPSGACIDPFNLSMRQLVEEGLVLEISVPEIMGLMSEKLAGITEVDSKMAQFISKYDADVM